MDEHVERNSLIVLDDVSGQVDLIEYKEGAGRLDYVNRILEASRGDSWFNVNPRVPTKDISQLPSKKRSAKEPKWNIELLHKGSKGYLQNRQMGKACKKE